MYSGEEKKNQIKRPTKQEAIKFNFAEQNKNKKQFRSAFFRIWIWMVFNLGVVWSVSIYQLFVMVDNRSDRTIIHSIQRKIEMVWAAVHVRYRYIPSRTHFIRSIEIYFSFGGPKFGHINQLMKRCTRLNSIKQLMCFLLLLFVV